MDTQHEIGKWLIEHNVVCLDSDELLYRVPSGGIEDAVLEEMALHRAQLVGPLRDCQGGRTARRSAALRSRSPALIHRRFESYAQVNPGAPAAKFQGSELSYGELDAQADALAALLQQRGLGPNAICALSMKRSLGTIRAILAVLKAGAAYLPLDPALPDARICAIVDAARVGLALADRDCARKFSAAGVQVLVCDDDAGALPCAWPVEHELDGASPAYAICVDRAHGAPHIAVTRHGQLVERLEAMQQERPIEQGDSVLQNTDYALDASVWEFLWPLGQGARLVIAPADDSLEPERMRRLLEREHITAMHFLPSMLQAILAAAHSGELRFLRALFCAGDSPRATDGGQSALKNPAAR